MTPTEIARSLTKTQRRWIMDMPTIPVSLSPADWEAKPPLYVTLAEPDPVDGWGGNKVWFAAAHAYKPVGTDWYFSAWLNENGLAVRAALERMNDEQ